MARYEFRLPDIGEGVAEGEVVAWHVQVGDRVREDDAMIEVMTDKAAVVIGSPKAGEIAQLMARIGDVVKVGDVLVVIETALEEGALDCDHSTGQRREHAKEESISHSRLAEIDQSGFASIGDALAERPLATPATRKLAQQLGIDLHIIKPSSGKKITREDVLAYANRASGGSALPVQASEASVEQRPSGAGERRIPFIGIRRRMAERMQQAKNIAAHFTFVEECEADRLIEIRSRYRAEAESKGIDLTYLPFIVIASIAALKKHPIINCRLDTETNELVMLDRYHIGVATGTEQGLVVPVIHDAQELGLMQLAGRIQQLATAARKGELNLSQLNGSTFTVTSLGKQSGLFATPVINLPNVAILSIHQIKPRPVVRDGQIVIGNIMLLSLSFDHRIVDGQAGSAFTYEVINYLEHPELLFTPD
ncbi:MAG: 2-oxo acid dehydrogenase subunit E2 [Deltaproteobacteria bacterium]|nr:2-oxo acid dehydrogenase subunit E2 [Deltaproteobacteria bacterium]